MSVIKSALTEEQLSKLTFITKKVSVFYKEKKGYLAHEVSSDSMERVVSLLSGRDTADVLKKGMKIYFISDGSLRMDDYKEYCRQNGYNIAGHPKNADVIVGHNLFYSENNVDASSVSFRCGNMCGRYLAYTPSVDSKYTEELTSYMNTAPVIGDVMLFGKEIYSDKWFRFFYLTHDKDLYLINDKLVEVLYWKMANRIPVINETVFLDSLDKVVIDRSMYDTLYTMLRSSDKSDVRMGFDLMCRCDIPKSAYYIWLLYSPVRWEIRRKCSTHTKIAEAFFEKIEAFIDLENQDLIKYLYDEGALTEEIYNILLKESLDKLMEEHQSDDALSQIITVKYYPLTYDQYLASQHAKQLIADSLEESVS
ncbi:hypothetical protein EB118_06630 [bacterium]|nr:hypothetical protein [bacterium]NDD82700.1 hypothetical protein [bacterium]NDG29754.1 hypothetical protein [bacterium]